MNIVLLGAPGCGKGTQNKLITDRFNLVSVVAGDILRNEKRSGSDLGKKIESIIDKGNLVPDEMIDSMIVEYLDKCGLNTVIDSGFIFDGYPRSINQSKKLDEIIDIDVAFFLDVEENILTNRILERGKTSGREDDQNTDIIKQRMSNYKEITEPIKEYYGDRLITIDGSMDIEEIHLYIIGKMLEIGTKKLMKKKGI